eukprot:TRINITY_DN11416_c0_g1_i1.p1 TRINITY_DN11416_c0_g1~~TRINITY_DN11416_c0_g1_i1.p1  ORF type:complete len:1240 (+),score=277.30 TRINITY_DN11416_c0_g1_i1:77-3721(+)
MLRVASGGMAPRRPSESRSMHRPSVSGRMQRPSAAPDPDLEAQGLYSARMAMEALGKAKAGSDMGASSIPAAVAEAAGPRPAGGAALRKFAKTIGMMAKAAAEDEGEDRQRKKKPQPTKKSETAFVSDDRAAKGYGEKSEGTADKVRRLVGLRSDVVAKAKLGQIVTEMKEREAATVDYRKQGDLRMYEIEVLKKRDAIKFERCITELLDAWWWCLQRASGPMGEVLLKGQYEWLCWKALKSMMQVPDKQLRKAIARDWVRDAQGGSGLPKGLLWRGLFELADRWVDTPETVHYVQFLRNLHKTVFDTVDEESMPQDIRRNSGLDFLERQRAAAAALIVKVARYEVPGETKYGELDNVLERIAGVGDTWAEGVLACRRFLEKIDDLWTGLDGEGARRREERQRRELLLEVQETMKEDQFADAWDGPHRKVVELKTDRRLRIKAEVSKLRDYFRRRAEWLAKNDEPWDSEEEAGITMEDRILTEVRGGGSRVARDLQQGKEPPRADLYSSDLLVCAVTAGPAAMAGPRQQPSGKDLKRDKKGEKGEKGERHLAAKGSDRKRRSRIDPRRASAMPQGRRESRRDKSPSSPLRGASAGGPSSPLKQGSPLQVNTPSFTSASPAPASQSPIDSPRAAGSEPAGSPTSAPLGSPPDTPLSGGLSRKGGRADLRKLQQGATAEAAADGAGLAKVAKMLGMRLPEKVEKGKKGKQGDGRTAPQSPVSPLAGSGSGSRSPPQMHPILIQEHGAEQHPMMVAVTPPAESPGPLTGSMSGKGSEVQYPPVSDPRRPSARQRPPPAPVASALAPGGEVSPWGAASSPGPADRPPRPPAPASARGSQRHSLGAARAAGSKQHLTAGAPPAPAPPPPPAVKLPNRTAGAVRHFSGASEAKRDSAKRASSSAFLLTADLQLPVEEDKLKVKEQQKTAYLAAADAMAEYARALFPELAAEEERERNKATSRGKGLWGRVSMATAFGLARPKGPPVKPKVPPGGQAALKDSRGVALYNFNRLQESAASMRQHTGRGTAGSPHFPSAAHGALERRRQRLEEATKGGGFFSVFDPETTFDSPALLNRESTMRSRLFDQTQRWQAVRMQALYSERHRGQRAWDWTRKTVISEGRSTKAMLWRVIRERCEPAPRGMDVPTLQWFGILCERPGDGYPSVPASPTSHVFSSIAGEVRMWKAALDDMGYHEPDSRGATALEAEPWQRSPGDNWTAPA